MNARKCGGRNEHPRRSRGSAEGSVVLFRLTALHQAFEGHNSIDNGTRKFGTSRLGEDSTSVLPIAHEAPFNIGRRHLGERDFLEPGVSDAAIGEINFREDCAVNLVGQLEILMVPTVSRPGGSAAIPAVIR